MPPYISRTSVNSGTASLIPFARIFEFVNFSDIATGPTRYGLLQGRFFGMVNVEQCLFGP